MDHQALPPLENRDRELFEKIHETIVKQQLFLDPFFSRKTIIKIGLINKNKVGRLFREYAGTNMTNYINSLRLDYAIKLMSEQPDVPMKAIAMDSGFNSIRTFYRLFQSKYGLSPTQYKRTCD